MQSMSSVIAEARDDAMMKQAFAEAYAKQMGYTFKNKDTKPKRDKTKIKNNKKIARKSRKRNRGK